MTTITNLVVALMIVTSGDEEVMARVVTDHPQTPESQWVLGLVGPTEKLYRKTCKTNFVYSAEVPVESIRAWCQHDPYCNKIKHFKIEEIFGRRVMKFGIEWDGPILCKDHEKVEVKE